MKFRNLKSSDHKEIISILNDWWGGRKMDDMLPKLFFVHFNQTSFVAEEHGKLIGFIIGFKSQTYSNEAYVHFVGVSPEYRSRGVGRSLYKLFIEVVQDMGCNVVRCVTSPVNKTSIIFHTELGFEIEQGDTTIDGISMFQNYDGSGGDRVLFKLLIPKGNRALNI